MRFLCMFRDFFFVRIGLFLSHRFVCVFLVFVCALEIFRYTYFFVLFRSSWVLSSLVCFDRILVTCFTHTLTLTADGRQTSVVGVGIFTFAPGTMQRKSVQASIFWLRRRCRPLLMNNVVLWRLLWTHFSKFSCEDQTWPIQKIVIYLYNSSEPKPIILFLWQQHDFSEDECKGKWVSRRVSFIVLHVNCERWFRPSSHIFPPDTCIRSVPCVAMLHSFEEYSRAKNYCESIPNRTDAHVEQILFELNGLH